MKKKFLLLPAIALSVVGLASCGPKADLKTVSMFGGTDTHAPVYEKLMKEFVEEHSTEDHKFVLEDSSEVSSETWKTGVVSSFKNNDEPDVLFFFTGATAKPLVDANKVVSIKEIRQKYPDFAKNIPDQTLDPYAVTLKGMVEGLYVNTSLFTGDLEQYAAKDKWTWAEFEEVCTKLTAAGKTPVALGAKDEPHYWIEHLLLDVLGPDKYQNIPTEAEFDAATGEGDTDADKWIKALKLFNTLDDKGVFGASHGAGEAKSAKNLFLSGDAGMYLDGSWFAGSFTDKTQATTENVKMIPFPALPKELGGQGKAYSQSGYTTGFYISRKAWEDEKKQKLAVEFIEKMTSKEAIKAYCEAAGGIPADPTVKLEGATKLSEYMGTLVSRSDGTTSPLSDRCKAETFPNLVSASASFLNGNVDGIKTALKKFAKAQN